MVCYNSEVQTHLSFYAIEFFRQVVAVALSTVPYSISILAHTTEVHTLLQSML